MSGSEPVSGLNLHNLPLLEPPRDAFPAIMAATGQTPQVRPLTRRWLPLAAAATALITLGLIIGLAVRNDLHQQQMDDWIAYSQELEGQLKRIQRSTQVMRGHRAAAISTLTSEVARIDWALAQRPEPGSALRLWQTRAGLLNDLVTVHAGSHWLNDPGTHAPVVTLNSPVPVDAGAIEI